MLSGLSQLLDVDRGRRGAIPHETPIQCSVRFSSVINDTD